MPGKFVIDVSTLTGWVGNPVGLVRVERELVAWARKNLANAEFAFFDPVRSAYYRVAPRSVDLILSGDLKLWDFPVQGPGHRSHRRASRSGTFFPLRPRRQALLLLERIRLAAPGSRLAGIAERLQASLITGKFAKDMIDEKGRRRAILTYRTALGRPIVFDRETILVMAGVAWNRTDVALIAELKKRSDFAFVHYCADIIPIQFPHFFEPEGIAPFEDHYRIAFPLADLVVVSSRKVEEDVRAHCRRSGLALRRIACLPLGADAVEHTGDPVEALPEGLAREKYALFVSTIEPRKGHALLYRVWLRLLAEGIPQSAEFRLVFAGRKGWMVDELMHALESDERLRGTLIVLTSVADPLLQSLYANAAFCLYPSVYEGFGLPLVEAFLRGKAVIASTGGSIPEVVGRFSPCIDPNDEEAWYAALKSWMLDPTERHRYEREIRTSFHASTWDEFAAAFFSAAASLRS